jgi:hypothetical protein
MLHVHIIYHAVKITPCNDGSTVIDCPDGVTAAAIAYGYFMDNPRNLISVGCAAYRRDYPELPDFELPDGTQKLVIVDFSFPASWLHFWEANGIDLTIIEHHADKFPWLAAFSNAILDEKECGATLAWKHFFPDRPMPELLAHVRRRDIGVDGYYQGKIPTSEAINLGYGNLRALIKTERMGDGDSRYLDLFWAIADTARQQRLMEDFLTVGRPILLQRDRLIAERLPSVKLVELRGFPCAFYDFTNDPKISPHYSVFGHCMAEHLGVKLAWMIDGKSNHLRSTTEEMDCAKLAAVIGGGGGHPCAAGWQSA